MKIASVLILIGVLLLVDGVIRILLGFTSGNVGLIVGGLVTGIALGGFLLLKGIRRYSMKRKTTALS